MKTYTQEKLDGLIRDERSLESCILADKRALEEIQDEIGYAIEYLCNTDVNELDVYPDDHDKSEPIIEDAISKYLETVGIVINVNKKCSI